ncbi:MAG: hypothetical protein KAR20_23400, partial [Candidatus Heimdallarchaeota archaeon]|nr:hypothetical protein [Candidatus Heimdallarchaeota archaeon]
MNTNYNLLNKALDRWKVAKDRFFEGLDGKELVTLVYVEEDDETINFIARYATGGYLQRYIDLDTAMGLRIPNIQLEDLDEFYSKELRIYVWAYGGIPTFADYCRDSLAATVLPGMKFLKEFTHVVHGPRHRPSMRYFKDIPPSLTSFVAYTSRGICEELVEKIDVYVYCHGESHMYG